MRHGWYLGSIVWAVLAAPLPAADLDDAQRLLRKGNYAEALETLEKIAGEKDLAPEKKSAVLLAKARCLRSQGKDDDALELLAKGGEQPDLLAELAALHIDRGRYDEARQAIDKAIAKANDHLGARWQRARRLTLVGDFTKANAEFEWFIHRYKERQFKDPESILLVARAAAEYARWNKLPDEFDFILNDLLPDAVAADADFWPAHVFAGTLLLEKYNKAEGVPELKKALAINPSAVEALVGLGAAALQDFDFNEAKVFAEQALAVNPRSAAALRLKGDILFADGRTDAAEEPYREALAIHPASEETLGRLAACRILQRKRDEASALEKEALARNPSPGIFYATVGEQLEERRQFDDAEDYFLKAIKAAPHLAAPRNGLGMLYMKIGKEDEARKVFQEARELDPFHVRALNMTKVLDHLKGYTVIKSPHYEVWVRTDKDPLLGRYVSEYLEETHDALCKRFGYEPKERSKIEIMIDHSWFSARVVGLPSIGTVGACTGSVVALTSPRSLKSPFHWARVLTHEVTHILTLQQTRFNIPHWYTEALAVLSEGYPRPEVWNQLLAERAPRGELFNLDTINHAFGRPKTPLDWQMAYCQALLYAEYMIERFGDRAIPDLLDAYRDGLETEVAIRRAFKVDKADFEKGYRAYVEKVAQGLKTRPTKERSFAEAEKALRADPKDAQAAAELALHHLKRKNPAKARELAEQALQTSPNQPLARYVLARMEWSIGKPDAALELLAPAVDRAALREEVREEVLDLLAAIYIRKKEYDKAAELYELGRKADPLSKRWVEGLARVYLQSGEDKKLRGVLEELARMDSDNLSVRRKLAEMADKESDPQAARKWALETLYVDVADPEAHRILGRAALAAKDYSLAVRELETARRLKSKSPTLSTDLGEAYLRAGRKEDARTELKRSLERDPADPRAKALLAEADKS